MYRLSWMSIAPALLAATGLAAQNPTRMAPGQRIRISIPAVSDQPMTGTVVSLDAGRLVFRPEQARFAADRGPNTPWTVESVQVNRRRSTPWRPVVYGGFGLLAGAATGALIWPLVSTSGCRPDKVAETHGTGCVKAFAFEGKKIRDGAVMFGAIGAFVGTIVGVVTGAARWDVVPIDGITVTIAPKIVTRGIEGTLRF